MKTYRIMKYQWLIIALAAILLTGCSDNEDDTNGTGNYKLLVSNSSSSYLQNDELEEATSKIIEAFSPTSTGFECTLEEAGKRWDNACDSILKTNWLEKDVAIGDTTWVEIALVKETGTNESNTIVNRRRIEFPIFLFSFKTDNASSNYALNIRAQMEVAAILKQFYSNGKETFSSKLTDAREKLEEASDSILSHNWKQNDLALQKGTSFTLKLVGGTSSLAQPWPSYASKEITLPHY